MVASYELSTHLYGSQQKLIADSSQNFLKMEQPISSYNQHKTYSKIILRKFLFWNMTLRHFEIGSRRFETTQCIDRPHVYGSLKNLYIRNSYIFWYCPLPYPLQVCHKSELGQFHFKFLSHIVMLIHALFIFSCLTCSLQALHSWLLCLIDDPLIYLNTRPTQFT